MQNGIELWGLVTNSSQVFALEKKARRIVFGLPFRESCGKDIYNQQNMHSHQYLHTQSLHINTYEKKHLHTGHNYNTRQVGLQPSICM